MSVTITKNLAAYNLLNPSEKQWCVAIVLGGDLGKEAPKARISQTWSKDDEPDTQEEPPSVVARLIRERLDSYLISTHREKEREALDWIDENAARLDDLWARGRIASLERSIERYSRHLIEEDGS